MIPLPSNWRIQEMQSGRGPSGRGQFLLSVENTRRRPTAADQERFNKYRRLANAGMDHATAYVSAMGRETRSEDLMRKLIAEGLLTVAHAIELGTATQIETRVIELVVER